MRAVRRLFLPSLLCLAVQSARAQQQQAMSRPTPQAARADSAFQQKSWQSAADAYRAIVQNDAANGMGWFRLGVSLDQLGQADDAVKAYGHAIQLGFQRGTAELRSARVLAKSGKARDALEHLRTIATLGADPSMFDDDAFASLRGMTEFAAIRKMAEETRFPCRAVHTFDYWAGTFDATPWDQPDSPSGGQLVNTRDYDGCVFVERWTAKTGGGGMSMVFYDVNRRAWRMVWNDDANSSNDFEGSYHDGAMRFEGWGLDPSGKKILTRNVLQDVTPDVIRHIYSTSPDSGKTWIVRSDGRFARRKQ